MIFQLSFSPCAFAQDETAQIDLQAQAPTSLDSRLALLTEQLDGPALHAKTWYWGWMAVFIANTVIQSVRLALVESNVFDAKAQRADLGVSAARSFLALGNHLLFYRLEERNGADPMRAIEGDDEAAKRARLAAGEATLRAYAKSSKRRYSWVRHLLGIAVNAAGFFVIWLGYDDLRQAVISSAIGLAGGQAIIWTQPWQAISQLEAYEQL